MIDFPGNFGFQLLAHEMYDKIIRKNPSLKHSNYSFKDVQRMLHDSGFEMITKKTRSLESIILLIGLLFNIAHIRNQRINNLFFKAYDRVSCYLRRCDSRIQNLFADSLFLVCNKK